MHNIVDVHEQYLKTPIRALPNRVAAMTKICFTLNMGLHLIGIIYYVNKVFFLVLHKVYLPTHIIKRKAAPESVSFE